jgi:hypothetical protein
MDLLKAVCPSPISPQHSLSRFDLRLFSSCFVRCSGALFGDGVVKISGSSSLLIFRQASPTIPLLSLLFAPLPPIQPFQCSTMSGSFCPLAEYNTGFSRLFFFFCSLIVLFWSSRRRKKWLRVSLPISFFTSADRE